MKFDFRLLILLSLSKSIFCGCFTGQCNVVLRIFRSTRMDVSIGETPVYLKFNFGVWFSRPTLVPGSTFQRSSALACSRRNVRVGYRSHFFNTFKPCPVNLLFDRCTGFAEFLPFYPVSQLARSLYIPVLIPIRKMTQN